MVVDAKVVDKDVNFQKEASTTVTLETMPVKVYKPSLMLDFVQSIAWSLPHQRKLLYRNCQSNMA